MTQRIRQHSSLAPQADIQVMGRNYTCSDPNWVFKSALHNIGAAVGDRDWMMDEVVSGFHARSLKGEVFFNPMEKWSESVVETAGPSHQIRAKSSFTCGSSVMNAESRYEGVGLLSGRYCSTITNNIVYSPSAFSTGEVADVMAQASTQALSQRAMSNSNLFETLAERAKTLRYVTEKLVQLKSIVRNPVYWVTRNNGKLKKKWRLAGDTVDQATGEYLAFRYGVMPVVRDLENVMKALRASPSDEHTRNTARGAASLSRQTADTYTGGTSILATVKREISESVSCRAMSLDEFERNLAFNAGFSAKGLMTLPYQLLGYSFVLDWFVNLGDFLEAHMPTLGVKQLGSTLVTTTTRTTTWTIQQYLPSATYDIVVPLTDVLSLTRQEKSRGPLVAPRIVVKSDFRFDDVVRVADATALVTQIVSRLALFGKARRTINTIDTTRYTE